MAAVTLGMVERLPVEVEHVLRKQQGPYQSKEHIAGDKPEARTDQLHSLWGPSHQAPRGLVLAPAALCSHLFLCCVEATSG